MAENSGGAHCLKYGFTVNHVLAADVVLPDGELVTLSRDDRRSGPARGRSSARRERSESRSGSRCASFASRRPFAPCSRRSRHRRGGRRRLARDRRRDPAGGDRDDGRAHARGGRGRGRPGLPAGGRRRADRRARRPGGAGSRGLGRRRADLPRGRRVRAARRRGRAEERARIWRGRKSAFAAMGRISPSYYVQDGVVPRTRLPEVLRRITRSATEYGLRIANVFHAGDGNLHPLVLYDDAARGRGRAGRGSSRPRFSTCASTPGAR